MTPIERVGVNWPNQTYKAHQAQVLSYCTQEYFGEGP